MKTPPCPCQTHLEPHWRPRQRLRQIEIAAGLRDWLFDAGSLTRRLRLICPDRFRVKVLGQYWARPLPSEARALGVDYHRVVWIREVQLFCGTQAWVFARTLIPWSTLHGRCRRLMHLGTRPLGEVLFTDPGSQRGEVEVACIAAPQVLHRRAFGGSLEPPDLIWGRRSVFYIGGRPLLVCEIFLPSLPGAAEQRDL